MGLVECPGNIAGLIEWITWIEGLRWANVTSDNGLAGPGGLESTQSQ